MTTSEMNGTRVTPQSPHMAVDVVIVIALRLSNPKRLLGFCLPVHRLLGRPQ